MRRLVAVVLLLGACANQPPVPPPEPEPPTPQRVEAPANPAVPPGIDVGALVVEAVKARRAGDDTTARANLDAALAAQPAFGPALVERAELLVASGMEPEVAAADAAKAVQSLPNDPRAHRVRAQTLEEAGDLEGALVAYRRTLELQDDLALVRRVALLEKRAGRPAAAVPLWERVRDAAPSEPGAHLELAELYEKVDRPASAKAEWSAVVELLPKNAPLRRRFADFLDRQGKTGEARIQRKKADELDPPKGARKLRPLQPSSR